MKAHPIASICLVVGVVGCSIGLFVDRQVMLTSYLAAWFAVSAVPIGALGILLTSYLVRGGWTQDLREPLGRAALTMPVLAVLFLPVLLGLSAIYPWASG